VIAYFPRPSLGTRTKIIQILPEVRPDEVQVHIKEYNTTNMTKTTKKSKYASIKYVCPFLSARDLNYCIVVSKNFNKCITTYLETYTPYFGLVDFTKELEKYRPEIEQISDQEKIITIQNPNPFVEAEIMFDIKRDHFYFPFTLEFSKLPIKLNINNNTVNSQTPFSKLFIRESANKVTFSPRTNTIFYFLLNSINFNSISKIQFKLSGGDEVTFKLF